MFWVICGLAFLAITKRDKEKKGGIRTWAFCGDKLKEIE